MAALPTWDDQMEALKGVADELLATWRPDGATDAEVQDMNKLALSILAFSLVGHQPPLLMSLDAPTRLDLGEARTPLGWASPRQQYVFRLPPGHTAVLYSDGLVENRRRGLHSGLDELVAVAGQAAPEVAEDPARLLEYLVDRMLTGYEQDDDVTVLVLHVPRRDGGAHATEPASAGAQKTGR